LPRRSDNPFYNPNENFTAHQKLYKKVSHPIVDFLDDNKEVGFYNLKPLKTSVSYLFYFNLSCCLKSKCKNQASKMTIKEN